MNRFPTFPQGENVYSTVEALAEKRAKSAATYESPKYGRVMAQWYY